MPYKTYQTPPKKTTRSSTAAAGSEESLHFKEDEPAGEEVKLEQMEDDVDDVEEGEEMGEEVIESGEVKAQSEENGKATTENGEAKKRPWPQRLKDGGVKKVPKDVLRRRRNFRLKKMVVPKTPVMILHELIGTTQYEIGDPIPPPAKNMPTLYVARLVHDGLEFVGRGPSKSIAKNLAAEQVVQHITTKSCGSDSQESLETDMPWSALASLAMFKLFNDWQAQGYLLPPELARGLGPNNSGEPQAGTDGEKSQKQKKEKPEKEKPEKTLPDNHMDKHPVQLLNEMKGPLEYHETGCEGVPPNCVFTLSVKIQEQEFSGQGRSKKEAKRAAAQAALAELYQLQFES